MTTGEIITSIFSGIGGLITVVGTVWVLVMTQRNKLAITKAVAEEIKVVIPEAVKEAIPTAMDAVLAAQKEAKNAT